MRAVFLYTEYVYNAINNKVDRARTINGTNPRRITNNMVSILSNGKYVNISYWIIDINAYIWSRGCDVLRMTHLAAQIKDQVAYIIS